MAVRRLSAEGLLLSAARVASCVWPREGQRAGIAGSCRDSSAPPRDRWPFARAVPSRGAAALAALLIPACATLPAAPRPEIARAAREAASYSGQLKVALDGPSFRGRARVLLGFRRPDALRLEVPGPLGPRLVLVANAGALTAVFPGDHAVFRGGTAAADLEALLGVALEPAELMDLLVGVPSPRLRGWSVGWGGSLPKRIDAVLPDGARLCVRVEDAALAVALAEAAFDPPPHAGYRVVDPEEARRLWSAR
jgi:hypothetical protein